LIAALRSHLKLEGIKDFVEGLDVADHGELLGVLKSAITTDVRTIRNVGVG